MKRDGLKNILPLLSLLLISTILVLPSCSESEDYELYSSLNGVVYDNETSIPLENANITLSPSGKSMLTDSQGCFTFKDLDAGQYIITVQKNGYQPNRKSINIISGEMNEVSIPMIMIKY